MKLMRKPLQAYRSYRERPRDRGAALVEAAIAIPILLVVIMGSIEFGFAWDARSSSASAVRTGLLRAASIGDQPETDLRILQSVIGEVGSDVVLNDQVQWVMIFEASDPNKEATIESCLATGNDCVTYDSNVLKDIVNSTTPDAFRTANFDVGGHLDVATNSYTCDPGKLDTAWCAGSRTVNGDVELGVAIRYDHEWFTGIFPFDAPSFRDFTVSSTFLNEGAAISPSIAIPTNVGQVYTNDFTGGITDGWSSSSITSPTNAPFTNEDFLGPFNNGVVSLMITTTEPHTSVCVTITLVVTGGWEPPGHAHEDFVYVDIGGDGTNNGQFTSDAANHNLDYGFDGGDSDKITQTICGPHGEPANDTLTLNLIGDLSGGIDDESWAIDSVDVVLTNG